ncbi:MAG: hypothetical protein ACI814_002894 [Mariniblastus sp.]|jgi:hypothetical protein
MAFRLSSLFASRNYLETQEANPMTTQSMYTTNDLILRLTGGLRDGELVPVNTAKCFVGLEGSASGRVDLPHCAIFRGPQGAAVRSYGGDVTVNGNSSTVHWLKEGDRIEFPNSLFVEVTQLGSVDAPRGAHHEAVADAEEANVSIPFVSIPFVDQDAISDSDWQHGSAQDGVEAEVSFSECNAMEAADQTNGDLAPSANDERVDALESQVNAIQAQNEKHQLRFDQIDSQLSSLAEHLNQLVSLASNQGVAVETDEAESVGAATDFKAEVDSETFVTFGSEADLEEAESPIDEFAEARVDSVGSIETPAIVENVAIESGSKIEAKTAVVELVSEYDSCQADDEKIVACDSEEPQAEVESAGNVEITDAPLSQGDPEQQIADRRSELENVFGSALVAATVEDTTDHSVEQISESESVHDLEPPMEPAGDYPANEQLPESFETPTHGLNEAVAPFAENASLENQTDDVLVDLQVPGSLASMLLQADSEEEQVRAEQDSGLAVAGSELESQFSHPNEGESGQTSSIESIQSALLESVFVSEASVEEELEVGVETVADEAEPTEEPTGKDSNSSSVTELLERMKSEGQWNGIPEGDDANEPVEEPSPYVEPEVVAPVESNDDSVDDVQDYMSQLLSRMRGDEKQTTKALKPVVETPIQETSASITAVAAEPRKIEALLKADEFKPKSKAKPMASLGAMRELANSVARSSVRKCEDRTRKELGHVQLGISVSSFALAVYYFMAEFRLPFDTGFCVGGICLTISGFLGCRFYLNMKHNEQLVDTKKSKVAPKAADGEPVEAMASDGK